MTMENVNVKLIQGIINLAYPHWHTSMNKRTAQEIEKNNIFHKVNQHLWHAIAVSLNYCERHSYPLLTISKTVQTVIMVFFPNDIQDRQKLTLQNKQTNDKVATYNYRQFTENIVKNFSSGDHSLLASI